MPAKTCRMSNLYWIQTRIMGGQPRHVVYASREFSEYRLLLTAQQEQDLINFLKTL